MLIWNSRGKLTTRLHTGQFWVIDSLTSFWQEMINKLGSTLDTEAGLEKIKQRLEREYIIPSMKDDRRPPPSYNFKAR